MWLIRQDSWFSTVMSVFTDPADPVPSRSAVPREERRQSLPDMMGFRQKWLHENRTWLYLSCLSPGYMWPLGEWRLGRPTALCAQQKPTLLCCQSHLASSALTLGCECEGDFKCELSLTCKYSVLQLNISSSLIQVPAPCCPIPESLTDESLPD